MKYSDREIPNNSRNNKQHTDLQNKQTEKITTTRSISSEQNPIRVGWIKLKRYPWSSASNLFFFFLRFTDSCKCSSYEFVYICIDKCIEDTRDSVSFKVVWVKGELVMVMPCHMHFIVYFFYTGYIGGQNSAPPILYWISTAIVFQTA